MNLFGQKVLPAVRKMRDLETLVDSRFEYLVLLDSHISQLMSVSQLARSRGKKLLIHADLIHGLKNDEYAVEFLCQTVQPAGIISTKSAAIATAKKNKLLAIQRHFLLDTIALEMTYKLTEKNQPDFIEVLPGVMPHIIAEMCERLQIPILAGGLIRTTEEVDLALQAGAVAVTTSRKEIWSRY
ncbi:glycerol-3-phosphate responsive antiterminator [Paenibacillus xerothermodurans]|uniref:Glycerol uptake operon antiterminator regulatory protein n=1 Tax=Paenibacillus xerothermodurans TaxID=1977292 RepID=A0A2W1NUC2_PAEXE|nr:glycerol-3-phosphate responsive antiterminator [Paenibacillus xerothermodurans]PZE21346.1 glycerol-3-phosphate responsive antiterminator [Paenibacillus xerothermodurans]